MHFRSILVSFLILFSVINCSSSNANTEKVGAVESGIYNGERVKSYYSDLTVQLVVNRGELCSGVIIGKNLIATAYHCVAKMLFESVTCGGDEPDFFGEDFDPQKIEIYVEDAPNFKEEPYARGVKIFHPNSKKICGNDVAFIITTKQMNVNLPKIRLSNTIGSDEKFTIVGYGSNNVGAIGFTGSQVAVKLQMSGVSLGFNYGQEFSLNGGSINSDTGGGCSGDSGGPAFSEKSNELVGVLSRGGDCDTNSPRVYSLFGQHKEILYAAINESSPDKMNDAASNDKQTSNTVKSSCSISGENETTLVPMFFVFLVVVTIFRKFNLI